MKKHLSFLLAVLLLLSGCAATPAGRLAETPESALASAEKMPIPQSEPTVPEATELAESAEEVTEPAVTEATEATAEEASHTEVPVPTEPTLTEAAPPETASPAPTETAPAHTHQYTASTVAPTCTAQGYTMHTCACGDTYKDSYTEALGHTYTETVVSATTEAQGYTEHTCTRCGDSYRDSYTPQLRWDTADRVAQICSDMNTYITSIGLVVDPNAEGWTSPQNTSYYTESEFRSRLIGFIDWYKSEGFTNLRVTYEANGDGSYTFYVKYNLVSG